MSDKRNQPIGYWIKQVDNLLTESINSIQAANGVSRSEWQVLNIICEHGSPGEEDLRRDMQPFVDADAVTRILTRFMACGWIERVGSDSLPRFRLTEQGRQQHNAILAVQRQVRERAMQGISEHEYLTVIRVLQRIGSNLDRMDYPSPHRRAP